MARVVGPARVVEPRLAGGTRVEGMAIGSDNIAVRVRGAGDVTLAPGAFLKIRSASGAATTWTIPAAP